MNYQVKVSLSAQDEQTLQNCLPQKNMFLNLKEESMIILPILILGNSDLCHKVS